MHKWGISAMSSPVPTPTVPMAYLHQPGEIILRAGDAQAVDARQRMQDAYVRRDAAYPDAVGLSVLFCLGATLDELAREGQYPHKKLSHASTSQIVTSLAAVGYVPVLFVTPITDLPDHHSLAVAALGMSTSGIEPTLPDIAADALLHILVVLDNMYRRTRP